MDLHFHGAFGIDLMTAQEPELNALARQLWKAGLAGFCPTTLSAPEATLLKAVTRLGAWIRAFEAAPPAAHAVPLGLHLEGPFLSPAACGAHPPSSIRRLTLEELDRLWEASQGTVKILTFAPEEVGEPPEGPGLKALSQWANRRNVVLSLGHSRATEEQATRAFATGVRCVTHAWNALPFHQRSPGPLGAALGNPDVTLELIVDQIHVSPTVMEWTQRLHGLERICFVSDCVPAAGLPEGEVTAFGPLSIAVRQGASRLPSGDLAGGGFLLPESLGRWARWLAEAHGGTAEDVFEALHPCAARNPLKLLAGKRPSALDRSLHRAALKAARDLHRDRPASSKKTPRSAKPAKQRV